MSPLRASAAFIMACSVLVLVVFGTSTQAPEPRQGPTFVEQAAR
jgi:hypothetical protein